ncbi:hypothetical protein ROZALSC1DRAFT_23311 [Rozella allomycis CSF55]|uniref:FERM domain-containing protein n=1 Tax=Rozella allomycis (strain CSF55) TaxID=988480 RepID=A0A4P9YFT5_ROZAC|nr:hypothetical protein ROZALSC1DRAFT_23311 [Rozella allomycis CSF55]
MLGRKLWAMRIMNSKKVNKFTQFPSDYFVNDCIKEIKEKFNETDLSNDYGLYCVGQKKWLVNNRTLAFYDLKNGDILEFKKKHRPMRVKMLDSTLKTVLIDESCTVSELVKIVCNKIGITAFEEYSFCVELSNDERSTRQKHEKYERKEYTKWLSPEKTLREQLVQDADVIILKRKFFFSDQNIDRNDPIQLNLLFVQSKESVISGEYPCSEEEAVQLAALQVQAVFGNYDGDKCKPGFLELKDYLPEVYRRKEVEKKIYGEYKKICGMSELNAKYRYVQQCRLLRTYGVTFFQVKEKLAKKTKFTPALMGVTKENILRVDIESREILQVWPLTSLKRWAATPTSFTLDFGDYDACYQVETHDGEDISQLIGGYIDMIIRKKRENDKTGELEGEEMAMYEETIEIAQPSRATNNNSSSVKRRADEKDVAGIASLENSEMKYSSLSISKAKHNLKFVSNEEENKGMVEGINKQALQLFIEDQIKRCEEEEENLLKLVDEDISEFVTEEWKESVYKLKMHELEYRISNQIESVCGILNELNLMEPNYETLKNQIESICDESLFKSIEAKVGVEKEFSQTFGNLLNSTKIFLKEIEENLNGKSNGEQLRLVADEIGGLSRELILKREEEIEFGAINEMMEMFDKSCERMENKTPDSGRKAEIKGIASLLKESVENFKTILNVSRGFNEKEGIKKRVEEGIVLVNDGIDCCLERNVMNKETSNSLTRVINDLTLTESTSESIGESKKALKRGSNVEDENEKRLKIKLNEIYALSNQIGTSNDKNFIYLLKEKTINFSNELKAFGIEKDVFERNRINFVCKKINELIEEIDEKDFSKFQKQFSNLLIFNKEKDLVNLVEKMIENIQINKRDLNDFEKVCLIKMIEYVKDENVDGILKEKNNFIENFKDEKDLNKDLKLFEEICELIENNQSLELILENIKSLAENNKLLKGESKSLKGDSKSLNKIILNLWNSLNNASSTISTSTSTIATSTSAINPSMSNSSSPSEIFNSLVLLNQIKPNKELNISVLKFVKQGVFEKEKIENILLNLAEKNSENLVVDQVLNEIDALNVDLNIQGNEQALSETLSGTGVETSTNSNSNSKSIISLLSNGLYFLNENIKTQLKPQ